MEGGINMDNLAKQKLYDDILNELESLKEDYNECYDSSETNNARIKNQEIEKCKDVVKKHFEK